MSDFIFSLSVTLPIFLVMLLGWVLRRIGILTEEFVSTANKFNFKVTLPVMLFRDLSGVDVKTVFDLKFVLFCAGATVVCFWLIWGAARLWVKDSSIRGAFVQASFRSSAAVMGLAFIDNIYGASAMGPLMIIGAVPLYNIFSVVVLVFEANEEGKARQTGKIKEALWGIAKNPIILAILIGTVCGLLQIDFPVMVDKTVGSVAQLATPLALIGLGAGFEGKKAVQKLKPTMAAAAIKLVIQPLVLIPCAIALGFTGEKLIAILIMLAAPTTPSCYIMAKNMKNDGVLTASVVVVTTLLAAFTLTGWIFVLRLMAYI